MTVELLIEQVSPSLGTYPDVPYFPGVDYDKLIEGDSDPMILTLPLGTIGSVSVNKKKYGRKAYEAILREMTAKKPGGNQGHIRAEDLPYDFPLPPLQWIGGAIINDTLYGKAYIPTYAAPVREYVRNRQAMNADVATSVLGFCEMVNGEVVNVDLYSIDLADPARAGVRSAVAVPQITSEMENDMAVKNATGETPVETPVPADQQTGDNGAGAALIAERDQMKTQLAEMTTRVSTLEADSKVVADIRQYFAEMADVYTNMGITIRADGSDIVTVIKDVVEKLKAMLDAQMQSQVIAAVSEMVKLPADSEQGKALTAYVMGRLGATAQPDGKVIMSEMAPKTIEDVTAKLTEIGNDPVYQTMARALVSEMSGGRVLGQGKGKEESGQTGTSLDDIKKQAIEKSKVNAEAAGVIPR